MYKRNFVCAMHFSKENHWSGPFGNFCSTLLPYKYLGTEIVIASGTVIDSVYRISMVYISSKLPDWKCSWDFDQICILFVFFCVCLFVFIAYSIRCLIFASASSKHMHTARVKCFMCTRKYVLANLYFFFFTPTTSRPFFAVCMCTISLVLSRVSQRDIVTHVCCVWLPVSTQNQSQIPATFVMLLSCVLIVSLKRLFFFLLVSTKPQKRKYFKSRFQNPTAYRKC